MVVETSAIIDTELKFGDRLYGGVYNNLFIIWSATRVTFLDIA